MAQETALVLGGTGGIGEAIVRTLAEKGFKVHFTFCRNEVKAHELRKLPGVSGTSVDFTQPSGVREALEGILKSSERVEVVVFALSSEIHYTPFLSSEWKDFQTHFDVQVRGLYEVVQALRPQLKLKQKMRMIVLLTEACIGKPSSRISDYLTAKYALMGLCKALAVELAPQCTVNMVSPGMTDTPLIGKLPPKVLEFAAETNPLKRITRPEDVAQAVSFLASEAAAYLNGVHLPVNGGGLMQ